MTRDPRLDVYKQLLLAWNEKINLIGPEARANLDQHIDESLAAAGLLQPRGEVLDFGSGGGLPAIPMTIVSPEARFHLIEADQKKWAFLKRAVRDCSLNATVYGDRLARALERFPPDLRFSLVTSRAVGKAEQWVPSLEKHLVDGARIALFQSVPEPPRLPGFEPAGAHRLPRGTDNWLVVSAFHVKHA